MIMRFVLLAMLSVCVASVSDATAGARRKEKERDLTSVIPAVFANEMSEIIQASDVVAAPPAPDALPNPISAAPPSDPKMPDWGRYRSPEMEPGFMPPEEYGLVGPPTGILQHLDEQEYQAVIADPNSLLDFDAQIGQTVDLFRPDGMGPAGMFGEHTLPAGKMFISYRYLQNSFNQNYVGSHRTDAPTGFPFAPTRMLQDSQVALVEYGVTNDLTMLALLPFQHNEIVSQTATGDYKATFTNPGDIRLMGMLVVTRGEGSQSHANFGLSIPVGFLEQQNIGSTPGPSPTEPNLPYAIRTSSGTYDVLLGYTYRKQYECWSWGAQANAVIPTGKNTLGYELGNQWQLTGWLSRRWTDRWSTSARLDGHMNGNIRGDDGRLNTMLSPANQANVQARNYLNGLLGVNYLLTRPEHRIREQRLFLESGIPLYQWVDGPQVGLSWTLNAAWGMVF